MTREEEAARVTEHLQVSPDCEFWDLFCAVEDLLELANAPKIDRAALKAELKHLFDHAASLMRRHFDRDVEG